MLETKNDHERSDFSRQNINKLNKSYFRLYMSKL